MKMFDADKTRMIGLPYGEKNYDDILSRFHLIAELHGLTDKVKRAGDSRLSTSRRFVAVLSTVDFVACVYRA